MAAGTESRLNWNRTNDVNDVIRTFVFQIHRKQRTPILNSKVQTKMFRTNEILYVSAFIFTKTTFLPLFHNVRNGWEHVVCGAQKCSDTLFKTTKKMAKTVRWPYRFQWFCLLCAYDSVDNNNEQCCIYCWTLCVDVAGCILNIELSAMQYNLGDGKLDGHRSTICAL